MDRPDSPLKSRSASMTSMLSKVGRSLESAANTGSNQGLQAQSTNNSMHSSADLSQTKINGDADKEVAGIMASVAVKAPTSSISDTFQQRIQSPLKRALSASTDYCRAVEKQARIDAVKKKQQSQTRTIGKADGEKHDHQNSMPEWEIQYLREKEELERKEQRKRAQSAARIMSPVFRSSLPQRPSDQSSKILAEHEPPPIGHYQPRYNMVIPRPPSTDLKVRAKTVSRVKRDTPSPELKTPRSSFQVLRPGSPSPFFLSKAPGAGHIAAVRTSGPDAEYDVSHAFDSKFIRPLAVDMRKYGAGHERAHADAKHGGRGPVTPRDVTKLAGHTSQTPLVELARTIDRETAAKTAATALRTTGGRIVHPVQNRFLSGQMPKEKAKVVQFSRLGGRDLPISGAGKDKDIRESKTNANTHIQLHKLSTYQRPPSFSIGHSLGHEPPAVKHMNVHLDYGETGKMQERLKYRRSPTPTKFEKSRGHVSEYELALTHMKPSAQLLHYNPNYAAVERSTSSMSMKFEGFCSRDKVFVVQRKPPGTPATKPIHVPNIVGSV